MQTQDIQTRPSEGSSSDAFEKVVVTQRSFAHAADSWDTGNEGSGGEGSEGGVHISTCS